MTKRLMLDLGAHLGSDSAYYLANGWRVIAVEAHPGLANQLRSKFHITPMDVRVVHRAITADGGEAKLFVSNKGLQGETHSIFPHRVKGCEPEGYTVPGTTVGYLLKTYGVPDYMKVDIEGADLVAIRQLHEWTTKNLAWTPPAYLSVELCPDHPEEALEIFSHLAYMGYDLFSIEEQDWNKTVDVDWVEHRLPINAMAGLWFMHIAGNVMKRKDAWFDLHARHSSVEEGTV